MMELRGRASQRKYRLLKVAGLLLRGMLRMLTAVLGQTVQGESEDVWLVKPESNGGNWAQAVT